MCIQKLIKNKIKKEAACKKEAGKDAEHVSFTARYKPKQFGYFLR